MVVQRYASFVGDPDHLRYHHSANVTSRNRLSQDPKRCLRRRSSPIDLLAQLGYPTVNRECKVRTLRDIVVNQIRSRLRI